MADWLKPPPPEVYDREPWWKQVTSRQGPSSIQTMPHSIEEALLRSQEASKQNPNSTIDLENLKAYLAQRSVDDMEPTEPPRKRPMPIPNTEPFGANMSWTAFLKKHSEPYRKTSEELLNSDALHSAIQGAATGTGVGMVRPAELGFDFFNSPRLNTKLFSNNMRLSPEMETVTGTINLKDKTAYLSHLFTNDSYKFQGAAEESLLGAARQFKAQGIKEISLDSVGSAFDFYKKLGFKATEKPEWVGATINMRTTPDELLANLEKRGVESKYPAERTPRSRQEVAAIEKTIRDSRPMIEGRRGPAHAHFSHFDNNQFYYQLDKPILDVFGNELHPAGATLPATKFRDYGFDIPPAEIQAARQAKGK